MLHISNTHERLKFEAEFWVSSAGAEATVRKLFPLEGMFSFYSRLITPSEGWELTLRK